jgi:hypothetical protein
LKPRGVNRRYPGKIDGKAISALTRFDKDPFEPFAILYREVAA